MTLDDVLASDRRFRTFSCSWQRANACVGEVNVARRQGRLGKNPVSLTQQVLNFPAAGTCVVRIPTVTNIGCADQELSVPGNDEEWSPVGGRFNIERIARRTFEIADHDMAAFGAAHQTPCFRACRLQNPIDPGAGGIDDKTALDPAFFAGILLDIGDIHRLPIMWANHIHGTIIFYDGAGIRCRDDVFHHQPFSEGHLCIVVLSATAQPVCIQSRRLLK